MNMYYVQRRAASINQAVPKLIRLVDDDRLHDEQWWPSADDELSQLLAGCDRQPARRRKQQQQRHRHINP